MWCVLRPRLKCIHEYIRIEDSHVYAYPSLIHEHNHQRARCMRAMYEYMLVCMAVVLSMICVLIRPWY